MELGTAIVIVSLLAFLIFNRGFRIFAICCMSLVILAGVIGYIYSSYGAPGLLIASIPVSLGILGVRS